VKKDCEARGLTVVEAERVAQDRQLWRTMLKNVLLYCQGAKEEEEEK